MIGSVPDIIQTAPADGGRCVWSIGMRRVALLASMIMLNGCSGFGKWLSDTVTLPGANPNMPYGYSENLRRVQGANVVSAPILPESGNVWPEALPAMPTLEEIARSHNNGEDIKLPELPDGGEMSIGDDEGKYPAASLPDAEYDPAQKLTAGASGPGTVEIPNSDGTTTLIRPDGSVVRVQNAPSRKQPGNGG